MGGAALAGGARWTGGGSTSVSVSCWRRSRSPTSRSTPTTSGRPPIATRRATLERTFDDIDRFDPGGPVVYDIDNLTPFEPYSTAVMMRLRERGIEFRFNDESMLRQMGEQRRVDGSEVAHLRQFQRAEALLYDGDGCIVSLRSGVSPADEEAADALIAAAADDLASGTM